MEVSGQLHAPTALLQGKNPGIHYVGGWMSREPGWTVLAKIISFPYLLGPNVS